MLIFNILDLFHNFLLQTKTNWSVSAINGTFTGGTSCFMPY